VIGTDYGHTDTVERHRCYQVFRARTDLAPEVKRKILSDNARALYGV